MSEGSDEVFEGFAESSIGLLTGFGGVTGMFSLQYFEGILAGFRGHFGKFREGFNSIFENPLIQS